MTPEEELLYLADLCLQASYWRLSEGETKCPIELEIESRIKKCELHHREKEAANIHYQEGAKETQPEPQQKPKPTKVRALCDGVRRCYFPEETALIPSKRRGYPKRVALDSPEYREFQSNKIKQASEEMLNER